MEVAISAIESVDGNPVRLIVIPWKTPPPKSPEINQTPDQEPPTLPLIPFQDDGADTDGELAVYHRLAAFAVQNSDGEQWSQERVVAAFRPAPQSLWHTDRRVQGGSRRGQDRPHSRARPEPAKLSGVQGDSPAGIKRRLQRPGSGRDGPGRRRQRLEPPPRQDQGHGHAGPALIFHL